MATNTCRSSVIHGSHTDFLISAVAEMNQIAILTTDKDFRLYAKLLSIRLV